LALEAIQKALPPKPVTAPAPVTTGKPGKKRGTSN
jgi:hypothetical protein